MHFSNFIYDNIEPILNDWELFARSLPPGKDLNVQQLRDHAKEILETIADDMQDGQSQEERDKRSKGDGRLMGLSLEFAKKHASQRYEEGFDLKQVVSEYRALRASVVRLWTDDMSSADAQVFHQLIRFNEEIDQALTYSIQEFLAISDRMRNSILDELRDSEERYREIAKSLQQADKYKDQFLAILAHELRTPMAPVQTGIEVLRLIDNIPDAARHPLDMMERQMAQLVCLVEDLLDISRISRGKIILRLETVDISDVVAKAVESTSPLLNAGNRKVTLDLPEEQLFVKGDPVRLTQILGNLLSNAGKHTEDDGQIWISVRRDGHQAEIAVRDNGAGIESEKMELLFEMYRQFDERPNNGLGIGLALARKLVEMHGGTISGHSDGLGRGAKFTIGLPLFRGGQPDNKPKTPTESLKLTDRKVLVVDDNRDAAVSLSMLLELLGAELRIAHDGPSALAALEEFNPDFVLLDIGLPGMDGHEVAKKMRELPGGKNFKIIAVTGLGQDEDRQRSLQAGFNDHLVKPINLQAIERVLGS